MTMLKILLIIWVFTALVFIASRISLVLVYGQNNYHTKELMRSIASKPKEMYVLTGVSKFVSWFLFFIQFLLYPHLYVLRFLYEVFHKEEESCDDLSD